MPRIVDLRETLGPARQQGPYRGTCLAFAVSAAHEHILDLAQLLSVEALYWGAKQHDGYPGPGTTFPAADLALRQWGQPEEHCWPYEPWRDDSAPTYLPPPGALDPTGCRMAILDPAVPDTAWVQAALDAGTVVAIGTPTWPGLRRPQEGHLRNPRTDELDGDYHALLVVGYRLDTDEILLRNSWGTSWGDDGHAWISFSFVTDHVSSAWTLTATSVPAAPPAADDPSGDHP